MKMRTHTGVSTVLHGIYMAFLLLVAVISTYSFIYDLPYLQGEVILIEIITGTLAVLLWGVLYFELRALSAVLYTDDNGIGIRRFGKTKVYLPWKSICEIGVGTIPAPYGSATRIYLSDKKLSEPEKNDLITIRFHTVYFSSLSPAFAEMIENKCHLPLPAEAQRMMRK